MDNPFERYGLDPREGIAAITQRLKELAEDATNETEREHIRAAWEELTLHPARRLRAALFAHPETRLPLGTPPPLKRRAASEAPRLDLRAIAERPSVARALQADTGDEVRAEDWLDRTPSLDDDPVLRGPT